jgi:hypothetical protein
VGIRTTRTIQREELWNRTTIGPWVVLTTALLSFTALERGGSLKRPISRYSLGYLPKIHHNLTTKGGTPLLSQCAGTVGPWLLRRPITQFPGRLVTLLAVGRSIEAL